MASWISAVEMSPVARPFFLASSMIFVWIFPFTSTPIAPLYDFTPIDQPLADAAESVP